MVATEGTFILFSAGAGQTALDNHGAADDNPNSVFTRALLPLLQSPGKSLQDIARDLKSEVEDSASTVQHKQRPAYYDELTGISCLFPPWPRPARPSRWPCPFPLHGAASAGGGCSRPSPHRGCRLRQGGGRLAGRRRPWRCGGAAVIRGDPRGLRDAGPCGAGTRHRPGPGGGCGRARRGAPCPRACPRPADRDPDNGRRVAL